MRELYEKNPVCAILRNIPTKKVLQYAQAVTEGGIRMLEVATNTEEAFIQIKALREEFKESLLVGAGTVVTRERCQKALEAGAQFFLTPSVNLDTFQFCRENHVKLLPGVMTPSDVDICLQYGYDMMKLFPAGSLPKGYLKNLKGPFDHTDYVAVGGVNLDNLTEFLNEGYIGAGIGSDLVPKSLFQDNEWKKISEYISERLKGIGNRK